VHARESTHDGVARDRHVAAERHAVGEDHGVLELAVVRDVRRHHEEASAADPRLHPAPLRAGIERDVLADDVRVAQRETARLATVLEVLRHSPDAGEREDAIPLANGRVSFDHGMRSDPGVAAQADVRPDHRIRPDAHAVRQLGERRCHCSRMQLRSARRAHAELDFRHHGLAHGDETAESPVGTMGQGGDLEAERVARHDRAPEPRPLHAVERHVPVLRGHSGAELGQCLAEKHARHHWHSGEMPREIGLVRAHELGPDGSDPRLDLDHLVEERVREAPAPVG